MALPYIPTAVQWGRPHISATTRMKSFLLKTPLTGCRAPSLETPAQCHSGNLKPTVCSPPWAHQPSCPHSMTLRFQTIPVTLDIGKVMRSAWNVARAEWAALAAQQVCISTAAPEHGHLIPDQCRLPQGWRSWRVGCYCAGRVQVPVVLRSVKNWFFEYDSDMQSCSTN